MIDKGAVSFVINKVSSGNSPEHIIEILERIGYNKLQISEAFDRAGHSLRTRHQDVVAENDFLPPLNKKPIEVETVVEVFEAEEEADPPLIEEEKNPVLWVFFRLLGSLLYFLLLIIIGTVIIYFALQKTDIVTRLMQL